MKVKIFEGDLFLKLIKGVLNYSPKTKYEPEYLETCQKAIYQTSLQNYVHNVCRVQVVAPYR